MARRGGAQQLQTDIRTDEDLAQFMTRNGLIGTISHTCHIWYKVSIYECIDIFVSCLHCSTGGLFGLVWSLSGDGERTAQVQNRDWRRQLAFGNCKCIDNILTSCISILTVSCSQSSIDYSAVQIL